jgi:hypothetical protein
MLKKAELNYSFQSHSRELHADFTFSQCKVMSCDRSVSMATGYGLDDLKNGV